MPKSKAAEENTKMLRVLIEEGPCLEGQFNYWQWERFVMCHLAERGLNATDQTVVYPTEIAHTYYSAIQAGLDPKLPIRKSLSCRNFAPFSDAI